MSDLEQGMDFIGAFATGLPRSRIPPSGSRPNAGPARHQNRASAAAPIGASTAVGSIWITSPAFVGWRVRSPYFAEWVTETLRIACGERLAYVHMGFGSLLEEDLLLDVRNGIVVAQTRLDNRGQTHDSARLGWENLPTMRR